MSDIIGSVEFADREAEQALAEEYGTASIRRSIVDGQKGYTVTLKNGLNLFHFRLGSAFRSLAQAIGHGEDREVLVVGEPEVGNAWMVRRLPQPPPVEGTKEKM